MIEVDRRDLVGEHIGETAQRTRKKIDEALGGVLFIDEAYTLRRDATDNRDFGQEAIDTLLKQMEDQRGKFVVIAAGYPAKLLDFRQSNPGLKDRFGYMFDFEDYTPEQLMIIFRQRVAKDGFFVPPEVEELVGEEFRGLYAHRDETFSNARMVRNLVEQMALNLSERIAPIPIAQRVRETYTHVDRVDVEPLFRYATGFKAAEPLEVVLSDLHKLIGLAAVKEQVVRTSNIVQMARERRKLGLGGVATPTLHSVYLGNPGTGKTTVAQLMDRVFKALGVLERGHVVRAERNDLVAGYIGQTAIKTRKIIDESTGGVLFIYEAYSLVKAGGAFNDFGQEAIETLLTEMENRRGAFIVIAAGYQREMQEFLDSNPGLRSRFANQFYFEDYKPDELRAIFTDFASAEGFKLSPSALIKVDAVLMSLYERRSVDFANARTVRNLYERTKENLAVRTMNLPQGSLTRELLGSVEPDDIPDQWH